MCNIFMYNIFMCNIFQPFFLRTKLTNMNAMIEEGTRFAISRPLKVSLTR